MAIEKHICATLAAFVLCLATMAHLAYSCFAGSSPFGVYDNIYRGFASFQNKPPFVIDNIFVNGRLRTSSTAITNITQDLYGAGSLNLETRIMRERLAQVNWIKSVTIKKNMPSDIFIEIAEFEPFIIVVDDKKKHLISREGEVILSYPIDEVKYEYAVLPHISGPEALPVFMNDYNRFPLPDRQIVRAEWVNQERWKLVLDNDLTVVLPVIRDETDWQRIYERLGEYERELGSFNKIEAIDLVLDDRVYMKEKYEIAEIGK